MVDNDQISKTIAIFFMFLSKYVIHFIVCTIVMLFQNHIPLFYYQLILNTYYLFVPYMVNNHIEKQYLVHFGIVVNVNHPAGEVITFLKANILYVVLMMIILFAITEAIAYLVSADTGFVFRASRQP